MTLPARRAAAVLAGVLAAAPAVAADLQPHAITYQVTVAKPPADTAVASQISGTLSRTCDGWSYGSAVFYGIERNAKGRDPNGPLTGNADTYQERLSVTEKFDGTALQYTSRYIFNGRGEDVRGTATTGANGLLDVKSDRLPRKVKLPPETLLPVALRSKLIDALPRDDKTRPTFTIRTLELGRFHDDTDVTFTLSPPFPPAPPTKADPKGGSPKVDSPLLKGRSWTVKQTSKDHADWMESTFEIHESGVIARYTFKREDIVWRADVRELTPFMPPKCGG
ncbi:MAG TPA: DUF1849 family protein [Vineibacter sp.]|nr:DUF1849 family protein [Vineibacter sp.]